jgi:hypothetical protein
MSMNLTHPKCPYCSAQPIDYASAVQYPIGSVTYWCKGCGAFLAFAPGSHDLVKEIQQLNAGMDVMRQQLAMLLKKLDGSDNED